MTETNRWIPENVYFMRGEESWLNIVGTAITL